MRRYISHQGQFIQGISGLTPSHNGCVATIGSFDGVHVGHQTILKRLKEVGRSLNLPTLVMVFEPQPYEFFSKEQAPARLMRLREKVQALFAQGVDRVLCIKFDQRFRGLSAADFINDILVKKLGVAHLEIGDDFRFGCDRAGDFALLQKEGAQQGFTVCDTQTLKSKGERVSSTQVRKLLAQDRLSEAESLLGRAFSVSGRVVYGKQLGRTIGVPTANVGLGRYRSPVRGVYAVTVHIYDSEEVLYGVANVGVRPTVVGVAKPLLEVHIFNFNQDLYGQCIKVKFCKKLRKEKKFDSLEYLKAQIQQDIHQGMSFFELSDATE